MKRLISLFTVLCLPLTGGVAQAADLGLITQKFEELAQYADVAHQGFVEQNKAKGCFAEGMLYATAKLLTDEHFGDMTNEQAKKAVYVSMSMAQFSQFCMTGTDASLQAVAKEALKVKKLLH